MARRNCFAAKRQAEIYRGDSGNGGRFTPEGTKKASNRSHLLCTRTLETFGRPRDCRSSHRHRQDRLYGCTDYTSDYGMRTRRRSDRYTSKSNSGQISVARNISEQWPSPHRLAFSDSRSVTNRTENRI